MKRRSLVASFALLLGLAHAAFGQDGGRAAKLRSPGGRVEVAFALDGDGAPTYSVSFDGREVVRPSRLGLVFKDGGPLSGGMRVTGVRRRAHDSWYDLVVGKAARARDRYRELAVSLREAGGARRRLQLVFRAYDDGAAFRYRIPAQAALEEFEIVDERSEFRFGGDHTCWPMRLRTFHSNYEKEFERVPLSAIGPGAKVGLPLVVSVAGGPFVAVAEADLEDYAGMYLHGSGVARNALVSRLSPFGGREEGSAVRASAPHESPWRVLMIGDEPGRLVESTLLLNLNPPSVVRDPSWIRPGKAAWDWWSGQAAEGVARPGMNDATMKHYIDFASEMGLEYMLVDAGWYTRKPSYGDDADTRADITKSVPEIDLPGLVAYARDRGVGLILWLHWIPARDQMDKAFPFYERLGVRGVKVDFMDRDDQEMVSFYHRILKKAAEHRLVVDLHGAYKPTGLARTYPNYLTQEGVLGAEYNKWSDRVTAGHNVTLPFTRMLAGPMDYTPGGFRNVTRAQFKPQDKLPLVMTTRAHQLAMYVVYDSPLQMVADHPGAYRGEPGAEFLRVVPASWDETRVVEGRIGEVILVARRRGREWFVGAMTDESARALRLPLGFLGRGAYRLTEYADGPGADTDPKRLAISERTVRAGETLNVRLAPSGGYAARLAPVR
ncbi:MAG TPA: glycoside hydrolase family 97 protein [Pyrinomonadaceae bacterium]|nr:glycoside hydrolase family 97 protein [Pyrinomonadaceae bacterium]